MMKEKGTVGHSIINNIMLVDGWVEPLTADEYFYWPEWFLTKKQKQRIKDVLRVKIFEKFEKNWKEEWIKKLTNFKNAVKKYLDNYDRKVQRQIETWKMTSKKDIRKAQTVEEALNLIYSLTYARESWLKYGDIDFHNNKVFWRAAPTWGYDFTNNQAYSGTNIAAYRLDDDNVAGHTSKWNRWIYGKVWQNPYDNLRMDRVHGMEFCRNLEFAWRTDWRLPTKRQLLSFWAADHPWIHRTEWYWTSTLDKWWNIYVIYIDDNVNAWYDMSSLKHPHINPIITDPRYVHHIVRCVIDLRRHNGATKIDENYFK